MHKILRALILSDLFIFSSFGLIQPVFAIFLTNNITGATVTAVGIAAAIELVVKATFQIIVGKWADEEPGNRRELVTLFIGSIIMSCVPLGYLFSTNIAHIYLLQFIYGAGAALAYPGWMVIFTRYTRNDKAGYEWSVYNTVVSLGTAIAAAVGASLADVFGFKYLFISISLLSFVGTAFIIHIFRHEFIRSRK